MVPVEIPLVVLAAGAGRRFVARHHKLDAQLGDDPGDTVVWRSVSAALQADVGPVGVVLGAHRPTLPDGVVVIHNPRWADGQSSSVQAAIGWADALHADALVIGLGDQPFVTPDAWRLVARSRSPIAVATYDGARRNPVRLSRAVWSMVPTEGDEGARPVLGARPDLVEAIICPGSGADIDTVEDLTSWQNRSSTNSP